MSRVAEIIEKVLPNPWAIASREGRAVRYELLADMAGKLLSGDTDADDVLRHLIEQAPEDLGLDAVVSYRVDEECQNLEVTYAEGVSEIFVAEVARLSYGDGLCGRVALSREPLVVEDLQWSDDPATRVARRDGLRAVAGFPLLAGESLLGVLTFFSRRLERFQPQDVEFLSSVAGHVAAARQRDSARREIADRERKFRTLANSIPQLAWMAKPDGWIFWYNQRWTDYTGLSVEECQGWGWRQVHHPDHLDRVVERIQRSWDTGQPWEDTFPMRGSHGEWRWFLSRAMAVRDDDGRIVLWFGTNTDVTEQREAEEELRRTRDMAERANRSKSRFLAAASHDLRQPMQSMMLMLSILDSAVEGGEARRALDHLGRGMDAMRSLLDGLLDVSRLDAGIIVPEMRDVRLAEVLSKVGDSFRPVAEEQGLAWQVECGAEMAESDPILLGRILSNLVENATRYTRTGFVRLTTAPAGGGRVAVSVEDSGQGIPPEHQDAIWEEFHQVGNPERDRAKGCGLGLAIVRRLAALLGVEVTLRSAPGEGSTFTLILPPARSPSAIDPLGGGLRAKVP